MLRRLLLVLLKKKNRNERDIKRIQNICQAHKTSKYYNKQITSKEQERRGLWQHLEIATGFR